MYISYLRRKRIPSFITLSLAMCRRPVGLQIICKAYLLYEPRMNKREKNPTRNNPGMVRFTALRERLNIKKVGSTDSSSKSYTSKLWDVTQHPIITGKFFWTPGCPKIKILYKRIIKYYHYKDGQEIMSYIWAQSFIKTTTHHDSSNY